MVHVFCTPSQSPLHLCEVQWNISEGISYGKDTNDGSTDGLTDERTVDTQNFGGYNIIPWSLFVVGHNNQRSKTVKFYSLLTSFRVDARAHISMRTNEWMITCMPKLPMLMQGDKYSSWLYGKCPKISYTKVSDKIAYANSADPDQTAPEGAIWSGSTLFAMPKCSKF